MQSVPRLTRAQVRAVDRIAIDAYHMPGILLMENAARGFVDELVEAFTPADLARPLILCGGGNNGGDGLAIARHLHNRGLAVTVALAIDPDRYAGDALLNWRIVQAMGLPAVPATPELLQAHPATIVVDALFGTGLTSAPRDDAQQLIASANTSGRRIAAVDLPSGLDCDTGLPLGPHCINATLTVTFVAEKFGFLSPAATPHLGRVTVVDIGCPRAAIVRALDA